MSKFRKRGRQGRTAEARPRAVRGLTGATRLSQARAHRIILCERILGGGGSVEHTRLPAGISHLRTFSCALCRGGD